MSRPEDKATDSEQSGAQAAGASAFTTTCWSRVMKAGRDDPAEAKAGMEYLYQVYKRPIQRFICRKCHCKDHEAEDLTQGFFEHLIKKAMVKKADRDIGKFRNFLLGSLQFFCANEWDRVLAKKRGGHCQTISLDEMDAPQVLGSDTPVPLAADKAFNQDWASTLIGRARKQLKEEYIKNENELLYMTMEPALLCENAIGLFAQWGATLQRNPKTVQVEYHRMRRRFGEILRHEIKETVADPADVEEELRGLIAAIAM
jgi:RNA polymerase sigma-70 factor (ECF subfamily)